MSGIRVDVSGLRRGDPWLTGAAVPTAIPQPPRSAKQCERGQSLVGWKRKALFFEVVRKCPNVVLALHLDDLEVDIAPQQHQIDRGNGCSLKFFVWEHLTSYSLCAFALEVGVR